ncbi:hypothetical protein [Bacillus haynesii]|uniref:hypothetical protein n=1 Tax=Bacillus haynesii TaxID=1925021 RepID=UPI00227DD437|nr:hypothetical protein [Bacillus haynesii]MCY9151661.1 hypothetical protein [Bacillus haynesii]MEC0755206.1 hypothetical protein [Bacillus haynesii]
MSTRKIGAIIIGIATLFAIAYTTYKMMSGKDVGFNEIITISILFMMFFSVMAREDKKKRKTGVMNLAIKTARKSVILFCYL